MANRISRSDFYLQTSVAVVVEFHSFHFTLGQGTIRHRIDEITRIQILFYSIASSDMNNTIWYTIFMNTKCKCKKRKQKLNIYYQHRIAYHIKSRVGNFTDRMWNIKIKERRFWLRTCIHTHIHLWPCACTAMRWMVCRFRFYVGLTDGCFAELSITLDESRNAIESECGENSVTEYGGFYFWRSETSPQERMEGQTN